MGHTVEQKCCDSVTFWLYLFVIIGLLLFSGLMSGLTLGLMSLGIVDLEVIKKSGKPEDRKHAEKIVPVVRRQHLLLVTLLVGNAMAMEALPLFLDSLVDTWMAIVLSVTLLLMFGEILPQAVCSRYGLAVGAALAPIVRLLLFIMFPIAWPVSKLLDKLLGADQHNGLFGRAELKTLVDMHSNEAGNGGNLSSHETRIIAGALELADKTARHAMTPIPAVVSVEVNSRLDDAAMMSILSSGFSRIPVYSGKPDRIIGLIIVKNLLNVTMEARSKLPVIDVPIRKIPWIPENMPLYEVLHQFQQGRSHMAAVIRSGNAAPGFGEDDASFVEVDLNVNPRTYREKDGLERAKKSLNSDHAVESPTTDDTKEGNEKAFPADGSGHEPPRNGISTARLDREDSKRGYYRLVSWTDVEFKGNIIGIITREDVLDELLKEQTPADLVSSDCTIQAVDQEFTKVSMLELEASLHKRTDYDHGFYETPSSSRRYASPSAADDLDRSCSAGSRSIDHPNPAWASPLSYPSLPSRSPRESPPPRACVLAASAPLLRSPSPSSMASNHPYPKTDSKIGKKSTSLHRQHPISTSDPSENAPVPRFSFNCTLDEAVFDSWPFDPRDDPVGGSQLPSGDQALKFASAPNSPQPAQLRRSGLGSQSMNGRTPFVPRSRISGFTPLRNFISRAFTHGGQDSRAPHQHVTADDCAKSIPK